MSGTTGPELLLVAYSGLTDIEQDEAFNLIREARSARQASGDSELARLVRSLRRAAEHTGTGAELTVDQYREAVRDLRATTDPLEPLSRVLRRFDGSWRQAREACLVLGEGETDRSLAKRLDQRKVGKVWRWREQTLTEVLQECCADHGGRAVRVAEFDWWRRQKIELAKAQGNDNYHLPSPAAYRRVWKAWETALIACCGYSEIEVRERLQPGRSEA